MNLTGRILTLLILFLSVAFLVLALMVGATHQEWKKIANENKQKLNEARTILETYKGKSEEIRKQLNREQVARRLQLAQLESQLNTARAALDAKETQLREQLVATQKALDSVSSAEKRLDEQDEEVRTLREKNKALVDDVSAQRASVANLINQVNNLSNDLQQLEVLRMDLSEQLAMKTKVMNLHGLSDTDLTDHIPPDVEGIVLKAKDNLIAISLGGDDGVKTGHVFDIYRGDRFIGKAKVTSARHNIAAAQLIREFQQATVAEGDYVTTKL